MMLSFFLKSLRPIEDMSSPSIRIVPLAGSIKRNKALIIVDFPLPVLPTTPTQLDDILSETNKNKIKGKKEKTESSHLNSWCSFSSIRIESILV